MNDEQKLLIEIRRNLLIDQLNYITNPIIQEMLTGIKMSENVMIERNNAIAQYKLDVIAIYPDYDFEAEKVKARMIFGLDSVANVTGNQVIEELIGDFDIYTLNVEGITINELPSPSHNKTTGELYFPMTAGDKFRLTYKPI